MKSRRSQDGEGRGDAEVAAVRTERETPRLGRRGARETQGRRDRKIWGRGGDRPDAGEKSGKNAAEDRRAAPCGHFAALPLVRCAATLRFASAHPPPVEG